MLAEAGLLDGKRATTHWSYCAVLAKRYPQITVDPDPIFIRDGKVYTSAGITAGMDRALALVEEDLGRVFALTVARSGWCSFSRGLEVNRSSAYNSKRSRRNKPPSANSSNGCSIICTLICPWRRSRSRFP